MVTPQDVIKRLKNKKPPLRNSASQESTTQYFGLNGNNSGFHPQIQTMARSTLCMIMINTTSIAREKLAFQIITLCPQTHQTLEEIQGTVHF